MTDPAAGAAPTASAAAGVADMPFDAALAELQGVVGRLEQGNRRSRSRSPSTSAA